MATRPFDPAEYLDNPEVIAAYLSEMLATGDDALIARAIGDVARAHGMTSIAREANVNRENLYRALDGKHSPEFGTVRRVLAAFGVDLIARPRQHEAHCG